MKIDNYAVAMNAHYFNVQQEKIELNISTSEKEFTNKDPSAILNISKDTQIIQDMYDELSLELSKVLIKNINAQTNPNSINLNYEYTEKQSLNFQVQAYIKTDSKEIALSLDVSLSRSFTQMLNINIEDKGILKDPLVLSLDGTMPTLSSNTFSFDIDSDGKKYQVSKLSEGNGFLALDKNHNGIIDNGNELFGTKSGNGFTDLTQYDDDKNGWIDENDAIFDKLRIWQKTDSKDKLIGLGEVGIGAIFLGNTQTPFSLKSESNRGLGEIRSSGFFVYENGKAGVISKIDLIVNPETKNDLIKLNDLQKNIFLSNLNNVYNEDSKNENSGDKQIEQIQKQIKMLEGKLSGASDDEKGAIQAQIGALFSQVLSILAKEFN